MSDSRRTQKPQGFLQECPKPGPRDRTYGIGCGESVRGPESRRYYKSKAVRLKRHAGKVQRLGLTD